MENGTDKISTVYDIAAPPKGTTPTSDPDLIDPWVVRLLSIHDKDQ